LIRWFLKQRLFLRLGLVGLLSFISIILANLWVFDWSYTGRDNILDAHDAYYYNELITSWGSAPNKLLAQEKLNNLQIKCSIFYNDHDSLCANDTLLYWSNHHKPVMLCDYLSYSDTEDFSKIHNIEYSNYVSFGDVEFDDLITQATLVETDTYKYLLTLDIPPQDLPRFYPFIILALLSFSLLFLTIRQFLRPIGYIEKRIVALENGDLESELKVLGYDELAVLSTNFNTMVKEIKNLLKQKERLLSDVSHELRTPLAKIRLMLALMPEHKKVQDVDKQIKVLDSLITNILLSDQMSAPYSNLNIKKTTVSELIKQAVELTFVDSVHVDYTSKQVDTRVSVDPVKMSIAIKNLIENAYKYSDSDEKIKIYINQDKKYTTILVKDRGPGIEKELIENITKAFVRGSNQAVQGFGLGLSICYKVINAHGGRLDITNNPKGGASFTLCIPIK
jgi:signal transduction histidine kinase